MQTGKSMFVSNAWKSLVNSDSASHKSWHTSGLIFVASSTAKNLQVKSAKWVGGRERNGRFYLIIKAVSPKAEKKQFSCLFPHTKKNPHNFNDKQDKKSVLEKNLKLHSFAHMALIFFGIFLITAKHLQSIQGGKGRKRNSRSIILRLLEKSWISHKSIKSPHTKNNWPNKACV